ncbi:MAG: response regulator [bacterium]
MEKKKILIADDEPYVLKVAKIKFGNAGYDVTTVNNGLKALENMHSLRPDVLITDINMPLLTGKELCMRTNCLNDEKEFLTIVVTSRIGERDEEWAQSLQNTILLEKPFSPKEMLKIITHYFSRRG